MKKSIKITLALLVVIVALLFSAKPILFAYMTPPNEFVETDAPKPPDYSQDYYWLALPDKNDSTDLIPPNVDQSGDLANKPVDVFFVRPTGYFGPGGWNSTMEDDKSEMQAVEFMLASIGSAFNGCCRVFAPNFREAHISSFSSENRQSGNKALDLAYADVASAFEYYIERYNDGRPFILVGHSQGTLHGLRLLHSHIEGTALRDRLVAAYLVGFWLPEERIQKDFDSLSVCETPAQHSCIVSFDVYEEGGFKEGSLPIWAKDQWAVNESEKSVCVNPLTWTITLEKISAENHLGALPFEFLRKMPDLLLGRNPGRKYSELNPVVTEFSWAQCQDDGRLMIAEQIDNAFAEYKNGDNKSMHVADFGLFYGNIRANAIDRVNAYLEASSSP